MPRLLSGLSRRAMMRMEGGRGRAASLWRTPGQRGESGFQEEACMSEAIQISVFPAPDSSRYGMAFCRSAGISAPPSVVLLTVRSARASGAGIWVTVPVAESSRERRQWPSCAKVDSTRGGMASRRELVLSGWASMEAERSRTSRTSFRSFPSRRSFRAGAAQRPLPVPPRPSRAAPESDSAAVFSFHVFPWPHGEGIPWPPRGRNGAATG